MSATPSPAWPMIAALGITQIVGYGTLYYSFAVLAPLIAADLGLSLSWIYGAFSAALLIGGLGAPVAGRLIDRHGARAVMITGSLVAAGALLALSQVRGLAGLGAAVLVVEVATLLATYDAAFAALTQHFGRARARRAITTMTLMGGFASTLFWPLTGWLMAQTDWRATLLIYAMLHLVVCLPLHLSLPRPDLTRPDLTRPDLTRPPDDSPAPAGPTGDTAPLPADRHARALWLLGGSFALSGFVYGAATACWVILFQGMGHSAAAAVIAGTLMGPAQVAVRVLDMGFGQRLHPVTTALIAGGLLAAALVVLGLAPGVTVAGWLFAIAFGLSQGLVSIVRGTVPLALFGAVGFGARLGQLARLRMIAAALAPFTVTAALDALPPLVTLLGLVALTLVAQALLVPLRPRAAQG